MKLVISLLLLVGLSACTRTQNTYLSADAPYDLSEVEVISCGMYACELRDRVLTIVETEAK